MAMGSVFAEGLVYREQYRERKAMKRALIFVTHNKDMAGHADRLVIMKDGKIQAGN